jgi:hypothetical protein
MANDADYKPLLYVLHTEPGANVVTQTPVAAASPGGIDPAAAAKIALGGGAVLAVLGTLALFELLPIALVAGGASAVIAGTNAAKNASKTPDNRSADAQSMLAAIDNEMIRSLPTIGGFAVHSMSDIPKDLVFPPGHPLPGQVCRRHPLAKQRPKDKGHVFIPAQNFEDVLFTEREAELFRLLVDLGATRISIRKVRNERNDAAASTTVGVAAASVSAEAERKAASEDADVRTFLLSGSARTPGQPLEREQYGWLAFEPSWETVAHARLIGGCLTAKIELSHKGSFSASGKASLNANVLGQLGEAKAAANAETIAEQIYVVDVEFLPMAAGASPGAKPSGSSC